MEAHALPRTGRSFLPRSKKLLAALSDERLVEQVRRGNDAAFEVVFDRHHRGILSFCRHMLASPDEAEDAVQQTFISAFDSLQGNERDIKLKAWLYTIARNRCLSILRARREQPAELDEVPTVGLAEEVQQRSDLRELLDDMRGLPVEQRAALVLSEVGDLSHADVGAIIGCEVAKVKSLVFQARSSLIESRHAREIPCSEIREQLATATGGALRRGPLRRHLRACEGCAEFREDVMRQRKAMALLLPVVPSLGLKKAALGAFGIGGGGGAGGAAAGLSGSGMASLATSSAAVKVVGAVVMASVAVGGGIVIENGGLPPAARAAQDPASGPQAQPGHSSASVPGAARRAAHSRAASAGSKHSRSSTGKGASSRNRGNAANARGGPNGGTPHQHVAHGNSSGAVVPGGPGAAPAPVAPTPASGPGSGIGNGNAYGNGNGVGAGGSSAAPGSNGAAGYGHSAQGGQGVGNGGAPPGQVNNTTSNAGGNGNGSAGSNAGGNGKGNGKPTS